jgi:hypothetical protein
MRSVNGKVEKWWCDNVVLVTGRSATARGDALQLEGDTRVLSFR